MSQGSSHMGSQEGNLIFGEGPNIVQICGLRRFAQQQQEAGFFFGMDAAQDIADIAAYREAFRVLAFARDTHSVDQLLEGTVNEVVFRRA